MTGGTRIYINARNHDQDPDNIQVYVGEFPCLIPTGGVNERYIICDTSPSNSPTPINDLPLTVISNQKKVVTEYPNLVNYRRMTSAIDEIQFHDVSQAPRILAIQPSSVGVVVKQNFIRVWSNASQWPNGTIPQLMQDVYINANWTILLDIDPNPANDITIDGTVFADDTRDVFITAKRIFIRAGNLSVGSPQAPFAHKFTIQMNKTVLERWAIFDNWQIENKYIAVSGSINLYGSPPATVITDLTYTAFANSSLIYVNSSTGWQVGDKIVLSPSFGKYQEHQSVTIQSINANGSVSFYPPLKYTHYSNTQQLQYNHGSINVNTKVGHLTRNIKIISGNIQSWPVYMRISGYQDDSIYRMGSASFYGVEFVASTIVFYETYSVASTITSSSISSCSYNCFYSRRSNQLNIFNNVFYNAPAASALIVQSKKFIFNSNLIVGVKNVCMLIYSLAYNSGSSVKNNFCLGARYGGFQFPHINCSDIQSNPIANNTAGSCGVGFFLSQFLTQVYTGTCKGFSYIKAYACKIAHISNPAKIEKLVYEHFILVDNERGVTLKFGSQKNDTDHIAQLSYSYISAMSRPTCAYCYGPSATQCDDNIGVRLLSVTKDGQYYVNGELSDGIVNVQVLNSKAYFKEVIFQNFKSNYSSLQCSNNYVFRPHSEANAVAMHVLLDSLCINCDINSLLFADTNNPNHVGYAGGCGNNVLCTGRSNYLIIDANGTFIGYAGTIIPNNPIIGQNEPLCSYFQNMNAFVCQRTDFSILAYQSTAADYNSRVMWPVNLTYETANYSTITNGWREWFWQDTPSKSNWLGLLNTVYDMTFTSMAPLAMKLQIQKRLPSNSNNSNYIMVKLKYPIPNLILIHANGVNVDPIPVTDSGPKRALQIRCGDNVYYKRNYTTSFILTEQDCVVQLQLFDTIQITTQLSMTQNQFFVPSVLTAFVNTLCTLFSIQDSSRVKIVEVVSSSIIVNAMILPPNTTTTSNSSGNSSEPSMATLQQTLSQSIQSGSYSSSMSIATGYPVLTSTSILHPLSGSYEQGSSSSSSGFSSLMLIAIIAGGGVALVAIVILIICCKKSSKVTQEDLPKKEEIVDDSILVINESSGIIPSNLVIYENDSPQEKVTRSPKNIKKTKQNTNLQIKQLREDAYDFEEH